MASSGKKSLAVGHISGLQIDPKYFHMKRMGGSYLPKMEVLRIF